MTSDALFDGSEYAVLPELFDARGYGRQVERHTGEHDEFEHADQATVAALAEWRARLEEAQS
jgi:hypothetical protein